VLSLAEEIDTAIAEAVTGLRACGYSWAEIGARLGITRQAVQQQWARVLTHVGSIS
jgi:biotin operon repressor